MIFALAFSFSYTLEREIEHDENINSIAIAT